jgi:hypothetical protein
MQVLISWIGHTDLRAMAAQQSSSIKQKISELVGVMDPPQSGLGPVRTLVEAIPFDRIYLLSNYPKDITQLFLDWLGRAAESRHTSLTNPTDYGEIFAAVDPAMRAIIKELNGKKYELLVD